MCPFKKENKTIQLLLHSVSTVLVTMKYLCMSKPQNMNCVISVTLYINELHLYLYLKQAPHNLNVNSETEAYNVKC